MSHTLGDELESNGRNISWRSEKKTKKGPTESSHHHWLFIVNQPAGIQFLHHQCGDGRDFEEYLVQNSWPVRKPRPIERKSIAQGPGGIRTSTPAFAGTAQRFSPMASESSSHTWWQETIFRVSSLNILGFSFSSDSLFHLLRLWACPCDDLPSYLSSTFPSLDSDPCSDTSHALVISAAEMKEPGLEFTRLHFNPSSA